MTPKQIADYLIANRRSCRTGRGRECPVCGHRDAYCLRLADGTAALCPKANGVGAVKRYGEYGYLYILTGSEVIELPPVKATKAVSDEELHRRWAPRAKRWWRNHGAEVSRLARQLGVAAWALDELCVGWDGRAWTFPERSGDGLIVGVNRRFEDGSKRCWTGSRRGLTYSETWANNPGTILLVEGASDVAAGITLGLAVIGRPSNVGGVVYLSQLLDGVDRKIILLGERDKKPDGRWPGMDGAKSVSMGLATRLKRSITSRLLPDGAKDLRAWLNAQKLDISDQDACFKAGGRFR